VFTLAKWMIFITSTFGRQGAHRCTLYVPGYPLERYAPDRGHIFSLSDTRARRLSPQPRRVFWISPRCRSRRAALQFLRNGCLMRQGINFPLPPGARENSGGGNEAS